MCLQKTALTLSLNKRHNFIPPTGTNAQDAQYTPHRVYASSKTEGAEYPTCRTWLKISYESFVASISCLNQYGGELTQYVMSM